MPHPGLQLLFWSHVEVQFSPQNLGPRPQAPLPVASLKHCISMLKSSHQFQQLTVDRSILTCMALSSSNGNLGYHLRLRVLDPVPLELEKRKKKLL